MAVWGGYNMRREGRVCVQQFRRKILQEETRSYVKWIFRIVWWEDLDWIHLAQYEVHKVQWRFVVAAVMKLGVPNRGGGGGGVVFF